MAFRLLDPMATLMPSDLARVLNSLKFGKISLHVFSSKVDYAEARASTAFGILGVKVWICYKD